HGPGSTPLGVLTLAALGVVFGDIGTSPLYALRECFVGTHTLPVTESSVLGLLSLVFWSLIVVVSFKYLGYVMRADNRGEGGILALFALVGDAAGPRWRRLVVLLGLFGAALLYGDGMITPAISVLSAIEGLEVVTPNLHAWIQPITVGILLLLFAVQRFGTARIGFLFGPIILVWFTAIGLMGLPALISNPWVLVAVSPTYAFGFFAAHGFMGFLVLGTVFLVVTGAEALYADMGHFGRRPIALAWFAAVLPGLLLNYFGQGALILSDPSTVRNPFFLLAPVWSRGVLIVLATIATIIASQAVITGAFSLTAQAIQLGYLPRMRIVHTSEREIGQIYIGAVNWILMLSTVVLVLEFHSASNLAAAYGVAVTTTMVITTILAYFIARRWGWPRWVTLPLTLFLLGIDLAFLGSNFFKIAHGGWFPLVVGAAIYSMMSTWKKGRAVLAERFARDEVPVEIVLDELKRGSIHRIPGMSVYMVAHNKGIPRTLLHQLKFNRVLRERVVLLTLVTTETPYVLREDRVTFIEYEAGLCRVMARFGFQEQPNVPRLLAGLGSYGIEYDEMNTAFFLGRDSIVVRRGGPMSVWRKHLLELMSRNAWRATDYFGLPPNRIIELGMVVDL
ncbi:MAG TPA: potassium transporter Kup, partial [Candidatus Saccharimonadales bacterium]|nr:potassium transporter Kup [Candidatus Saccharimonadales bacterium]